MSNKKAKQPKPADAKFKGLEIPWWNTSDGLRLECPTIELTPFWQPFAEEYDKPENQRQRMENYAESRIPWRVSCNLMTLKELAEFVLDQGAASEGFVSSVVKGHSFKSASRLLAQEVLKLIEKPGDNAQLFAKEALDFYDRNPKPRNVSDAIWAFACFCKRERRLPRKGEVNIEAGRIDLLICKKIKRNQNPWGTIPRFGELMDGKRVYSVVEDDDCDCLYVCDATKWEDGRWEKSDFTGILRLAGLKLLPGR